MTDIWSSAAAFVAAFAAGTGFGILYFSLLWRGARGFTAAAATDNHVAWRLLKGFALRLALTVTALTVALRLGAGAADLLVALLGFTLTRQVMIRRLPRQDQETTWN